MPLRDCVFFSIRSWTATTKRPHGKVTAIAILGLFSIGVIELILIMSGFDIFLVDMLVGFLVHPFHEAVLCLFIAKFVGK